MELQVSRRLTMVVVSIAVALLATLPFGPRPVDAVVSETVVVPDLEVVDEVEVDSRNASDTTSHVPLLAGQRYVFEASGTYEWGGGTADAECSNDTSDPTFVRGRHPVFGEGAYDILVDRTVVEWTALNPTSDGCDANHIYRYVHEPAESGPVDLVIADTDYRDNAGSLTVKIHHVGDAAPRTEVVESLDVDSSERFGTTSTTALDPDHVYRFTVTGTYTAAPSFPATLDAECLSVDSAAGVPQSPGAPDGAGATTPADPNDDIFDLYVDGKPVQWQPTEASPLGCNDVDHTYVLDHRPEWSSSVNFRISDPHPSDNDGILHVTVERLIDPPPAPLLPVETENPTAIVLPDDVVDEVVVDSRNASDTTSSVPLLAGQRYVFEASGTYEWGGGTADAECSNDTSDPTFVRGRHPVFGEGAYDILVDRAVVEWAALNPTSAGCDEGHVYRYVHEPAESGPVDLVIADTDYRDNAGSLTVKIYAVGQPDPRTVPVEALDVDSSEVSGTTSTTVLDPDHVYRFTVTGTYTAAPSFPATLDAECLSVDSAAGVPESPGAPDGAGATTPADPNDDVFDLYVEGRPVRWQPTEASPLGCNDVDHTYVLDHSPSVPSSVNFRIFDPHPSDNDGILRVTIERLIEKDVGLAVGPLVPFEELELDSRSRSGASTVLPLEAGTPYQIEITGTYSYGRDASGALVGFADAECSNALEDPVFLRDRYAAAFPDTDILDVLVDGRTVDWDPTSPDVNGCNTEDHTYELLHVPETTGSVNFRVNDPGPGDNAGTLRVRVFRLSEVPVATVVVNSADVNGVITPPLLTGREYRLEVSGTYNPHYPNAYEADAECSADASGVFVRERFPDAVASEDDLLDVYVDDQAIEWVALRDGADCDPTNTYEHHLRVDVNRSVKLAVFDTIPDDNVGFLVVRVFEMA